jgi:hypothetical protein
VTRDEARLIAVAEAIRDEEDRIALERVAVDPATSLARKLIAGQDALAAFDSEQAADEAQR